MIDGEKHSLNAGNLTDCADIMSPDNTADELIATATNAGDSADFSGGATIGLIASVNAGNSTDCADISFRDYAADELINTNIDAGNLTDCAEDCRWIDCCY